MFDFALSLPITFAVVFVVIYKIILLSLSIVMVEMAFKMTLLLPLFVIVWIFAKLFLRKVNRNIVIRVRVADKQDLDMPFKDRESASMWVRSLEKGTYEWYKELNNDGTLIHFGTT